MVKFHSQSFIYSDLKFFTGLAIAAFTDWKLIVTSAINIAAVPDEIKIHTGILMRYAKLSSQLRISHHETGDVIIKAMAISFIKSLDSITVILITEAPKTLRTLISFFRWAML